MRLVRAAVLAASLAVPVGCTLFSDFGGFSEGAPAPGADSGGGDASTSTDAATTTDGTPSGGDAGPDGSPYKLAVLADSPVAYWPLDEAAGANVAKDVIGGRNAEVIGTVKLGVKGIDGNALEREVGGGRLEVGDFFDLAGNQAYSIEFWGWEKGVGDFENVLAKRDGALKGWIVYFRNDGFSTSIQIEQKYAAGQRTTYAPVPDARARLHHIVFVFDPAAGTDTRQRVYIDSIRTDGFSDDGAADDVTTPLVFVPSFIGVLDEIAIYDHALTATRIAEHFALGKN